MSNLKTLRDVIEDMRDKVNWGRSYEPHLDSKYEGIKEVCDYLESKLADCTLDAPITEREEDTCFMCERYTLNHGCIIRGGTKHFCYPKDKACGKFKPLSE